MWANHADDACPFSIISASLSRGYTVPACVFSKASVTAKAKPLVVLDARMNMDTENPSPSERSSIETGRWLATSKTVPRMS